MNLLVRSLSGNNSGSGTSGSGSPSSPTAPPRSTSGTRRSKPRRSNHPPLFSSHSSPGDLSPTCSSQQRFAPRQTASSWNDATRMVYDLEADISPSWTSRRTGGFEYPPDTAPPSTSTGRDFDYFEYFSNYGRGVTDTPSHTSVSPSGQEYRWPPSRIREQLALDTRFSHRFRRPSAEEEEDHRSLNDGFRRLWRRSSRDQPPLFRDTPSFHVTPPLPSSSVPSSSLPSSSVPPQAAVQVPMNDSSHHQRQRTSLIIEHDEQEEPDDTILLASSLPSSSLSQHRSSYDATHHHPSSFSPSHQGGIKKRNSSFSSPPPTATHHHHPLPIFSRKLSAASNPLQHRPSVMFHPSSSSAFEDSRSTLYYDANDCDITNDPMSEGVSPQQHIHHHAPHHHRTGSLYDPRGSNLRYEMDSATQVRRASAAVTSNTGSSVTSLGTVVQRANVMEERSSVWNPFRISFIETSAYTPQDIPDTTNSPDSEFIPSLPSIQSQTNFHSKFQKQLHGEWVNETVGELRKWFKSPATQILVNVESKSKYPFIIFGSLGPSFNASGFVPSASTEPLSPELRINDGIYNVCGSVSRPAPCSGSSHHHLQLDPDATPLGYVVTAFQTFPGEDSERLERNWITWTGAQVLYKYLPITVGLRNIIFYKRHDLHLLKNRTTVQCAPMQQQSVDSEEYVSSPEGEVRGMRSSSDGTPLISYILLCECLTLSESILTSTCAVIDQLRARCCGYSALYINYSLGSSRVEDQQRHPLPYGQEHRPQEPSHQPPKSHHQEEMPGPLTSSQYNPLPPHFSRPSHLHIS